MSDPGERIGRLAQRQLAKSAQADQVQQMRRQQLRDDMPCVAEFVDLLRGSFGEDCRVLFATENGKSVAAVKRLQWLGLDEQGR